MDNPSFKNEEAEEISSVVIEKMDENTLGKNEKSHTFEEAIELTEVGIFHYFLQIICGLCLMTAVVEAMGTSMIMPFINQEIPSTIAEKGYLASAGFLGIVLSSHAVGFLSDTWGRANMLRTTLSLSFVTSAISAFSINIWMLIILRFVTGFIMSACQGSIYNFVGEYHSRKSRAKYVTMLSIFLQLGMIFLPAMGSLILPLQLNTRVFGMQFVSWRLLLLIYSFVRIFALVGLFLIPETPKFVLSQGDHDQALKTLRMMFVKNTGRSKNEYPVQNIITEGIGESLKNIHGIKDAIQLIWKQTSPLFSRSRFLHTTNLSIMIFLVSAVAQGAYMWFPSILKQQIANANSGLTTCQIMNIPQNVSNNISMIDENDKPNNPQVDTFMFKILILIGVIFSVSYFFFSMIIGKVGKRNLLVISVLVSGLSALIFKWLTIFSWSVVTFTIIMSIGNCTGIVGTMAFEFFPTNVSAMGMCLIMMIARIGSVVGANFFGIMIHNHCDWLFSITFAVCIFMGGLSFVLPNNEKQTKK